MIVDYMFNDMKNLDSLIVSRHVLKISPQILYFLIFKHIALHVFSLVWLSSLAIIWKNHLAKVAEIMKADCTQQLVTNSILISINVQHV